MFEITRQIFRLSLKKLEGSIIEVKQTFSENLNNWGNIILLNIPSRTGGIRNEWNSCIDNKAFLPQMIDGFIIRSKN
mgnify:CR=1 FL=1